MRVAMLADAMLGGLDGIRPLVSIFVGAYSLWTSLEYLPEYCATEHFMSCHIVSCL